MPDTLLCMWFILQILSVTFWAALNVIDSLMVKHYHKHPIVLGWNQSYFSLSYLLILALVFQPSVAWALPLLSVGVIAFFGDIVFWRALDRIDISVANIAWAILSLFLAIGGFVLFDERWTSFHTIGSILVIGGVSLLSTWQRRIDSVRSLWLLPLLALLYTPFYLVQKAALLGGASAFDAFFWTLAARESMFFCTPAFVPSFRSHIRAHRLKAPWSFYALNVLAVSLFFIAIYLTAQAFRYGPVSLVGMVGNVQPFIVLFFAWALTRIAPLSAARELLTKQSVAVKIVSFTIVFMGLALLALSP